MPFSKTAINFLYQNSASIGRLFNVQEQKNFLLQFVAEKEVQKFLNAGKTNSDQVEKLIAFIQYKNHNSLYEAIVDQLMKIHEENGQFINTMLQTCEKYVDGKKDDMMIVTHKYKMEKELMNSMKEILSDMKIICQENQNLKIVENDEQEIRRIHDITNEIHSKEIMKLNAEIKHLNDEWSQSLDKIEHLELQVAKQLSLQDIKIENSTNVEVKLIQRQLNPEDSDEAAESLNKKGNVHYKQNEFNEALNGYNEALEMSQRLHNGDHVHTAQYLSNIAACYYKLQLWSKSLEYHTKCLQMRRRLYSGDHDDIASTHNWIGVVHYNQDEFKEALNFYNEALEMNQRLHNGDHVHTDVYLFNIAMSYNQLQQWSKSLEYHTKCLQMRRRLYSGDHVDIAYTLNFIGVVHCNQDEFNEALNFYNEALEMSQRLHNGDHVKTALYLSDIGFVHEKQQDWSKSLDCFTRCLEMRRRLYPGDDHVDVRKAAANVDRIKLRIK